jgi:predicted Rossmann fold nucleotide-binding protein DprA/Smf involved in DNA uptake
LSNRQAHRNSFQPTRVARGNDFYPPELTRFLGDDSPGQLFLLGNHTLLRHELLGLFCSIKCPGDIILKTFDLVRAMREAGIPLIGGFHTPMERECLDILLRGSQPIVICPARGLERLRPSRKVRDGIETGRILLVSPFGPNYRRATAELAEQRNRLVAALASAAFISHAAPGGKTEALCREIIAMGKPIFTVDSPENSNLLALGAKPVTVDVVAHQWLKRGIAW